MALPSYKEIIDLIKKGSTIDAQEKIMELRERSIELQEENFQLRDELRELKGKLAERESLTFIGQVYYSGNAENRDGPFCQKCHDSESKLAGC
jgi:hypothetical protein